MKNVVIVDGVRTPFVKFAGVFKDLAAQDLGALAVKELVERTNLSVTDIDEVIVGNVAQPPDATNIARNIALFAGLPQEIPAFSVQRNCSSGMQSVADAWYRIQAGHGSTYLCGGTESMSKIPLLFNEGAAEWMGNLFKAKTMGQRLGLFAQFKSSYLKPIIGLQLGLTDGFCGLNMGDTAEILAREFRITREEQDELALRSHNLAEQATESGRLAEEIMAVAVPPKFNKSISKDDGIRYGQNLPALAKLKPVFDRRNGTVTAGNASQITDGAAMLLVMDEEKALASGYHPLGRIKGFAFAGLDPKRMGLGPAYSIKKVLSQTGLTIPDIDLFEINEAFAAQVLANMRIMDSDELSKKYLGMDKKLGAIPMDKFNVNGGAIALGHPVGASATRLLLTLLRQMKRDNRALGLASLCVGGGQGAAFILENM